MLCAADVSEAQSLCQNLLNELLAGTLPWEMVESEPIDPFSPWEYSVQIEPLGDGRLSSVSIVVTQLLEEQIEVADTETPAPPQFRLTRWVYHPDGPRDLAGEPDFGGASLFE